MLVVGGGDGRTEEGIVAEQPIIWVKMGLRAFVNPLWRLVQRRTCTTDDLQRNVDIPFDRFQALDRVGYDLQVSLGLVVNDRHDDLAEQVTVETAEREIRFQQADQRAADCRKRARATRVTVEAVVGYLRKYVARQVAHDDRFQTKTDA